MEITMDVRWSDIDPIMHVRHSVYYDYGAFGRLHEFAQLGLTPQYFLQNKIGPVLFREECVFKKELHFGDKLILKNYLLKARKDFSRWTVVCEIYKNIETLSAVVTIDGAFIDGIARKIIMPSAELIEKMEGYTRHPDFQFID
jgi:acyl-CoA thioester hydrolase